MTIPPGDSSYRTFCELTSAYRMFYVINEAIRSEIIDLLEEGNRTVFELLAATSLRPEEGQRFISLLVSVGLLEMREGQLSLSCFSRTYLSRTSPTSQRHLLAFEPLLMDNWRQLDVVLHEGQGALIREQSPEEYRERLQLFQQAMSEAAQVRSKELWDALIPLPECGTIIDIGAGDCIYLREFLARYPQWQGVACDLPDVCAGVAAQTVPENLNLYPCNILEQQELAGLVASYSATARVLLCSNICHCYGPDENRALLLQAGELLAEDGILIIHDFFRDANGFGALYDLHMMVNTWNGRSYSIAETVAMLNSAGFRYHLNIELPSRSMAMIATRNRPCDPNRKHLKLG